MLQRSTVIAAAWLEIVVGAICVVFPGPLCVLLFGERPEGIAILLARFAGFGLLGLGISCLPSAATVSRRSVVGLLVFNVGVTVLFCWIAVTTSFHGILLWPVIILHGVLATALLPQAMATKGW